MLDRIIRDHGPGRVIHKQEQGPAGIGISWDDNGWITSTVYAYNVGLEHNGSTYRVSIAHTSGASTEPGIGADWETVWELIASGYEILRQATPPTNTGALWLDTSTSGVYSDTTIVSKVSNLLALQNRVALSNYETVYLVDRVTQGDGGGGTFVWYPGDMSSYITSDPNIGVYVAPSSDTSGQSGAWAREHFYGEIRPEWWGNGASAIQYAINFMSTGTSLLLTGGNEYTSGQLTLKSGISINGSKGGGFNGATNLPSLKYNSTTGDFISLNTGGGNGVTGFTLQNVRINGNGTSGNALNFGTNRSRIFNSEISNASTLINLASTSNWAGENIISYNYLHDCTNAIVGNGVNSIDNEIANNIIYRDGGAGEYAIKFDSAANGIHDNHIYGGFKYYVHLTGNSARIHDNFFDSIGSVTSGGAGVYLANNSALSNSIIKGNSFGFDKDAVSTSGVEIVCTSTGKVFIEGNIFCSSGTIAAGVTGVKTTTTNGSAFNGNIINNTMHLIGDKYNLHSSTLTTVVEFNDLNTYFSADTLRIAVNPDTLTGNQEFKLYRTLSGTPESTITANVGSLYSVFNPTPIVGPLWLKYSGTGNTGWRPIMFSTEEEIKGADATGTNVFSANASALGPNTGFMRVPLSDGSKYVYIPYWEDVTP